jgi:hypothetical protein
MAAAPLRYAELALSAQTAYAELFDQARAGELQRSIAHLHGSFASKSVKGRDYWYFAYRDIDGAVRQLYVGPDDERVRALIARFREHRARPLAPMARAAIALGCAATVPRQFRIVRRLAEYGFFGAGGVLIGTHAFVCLGNTLGIRFPDGAATLDVDFAHAGNNISVALPADVKIDVHKAIDSLEMGFLPITELQGGAGTTYLNPSDPELRLDFLTAMTRASHKPVHIANLNVALQPLKFMDFCLDGVYQAALLANDGAVVVNLPSPARFAIHKLIVYGERAGSFRAKANKDLLQAAALIEYLAIQRPDELRDAWRDALSRGPGWQKRARQGRGALARLEPAVPGGQLLADER